MRITFLCLSLLSVALFSGCGLLKTERDSADKSDSKLVYKSDSAKTSAKGNAATKEPPLAASPTAPTMKVRTIPLTTAPTSAPLSLVPPLPLPPAEKTSAPAASTQEKPIKIIEPTTTPAKIQEPMQEPKIGSSSPGDAGFQSLAGTIEVFRKTWRLRYASIEQEDVYGGYVVLENGADFTLLHDGLRARVRGVLIPPTGRTEPARFRIEALETGE